MSTGLIFPGNADVADGTTYAMKWANPQSNGLPIYGPSGRGVTYIWRYFPYQQAGYYTSFFWGNNDGVGDLSTFFWVNGVDQAGAYYGAHPYPDGGGGSPTTHQWEISVEQTDSLGAGFAVVKNQWYVQAFRVWGATGVVKLHEFYWNLPDQTASGKISYTSSSASYGDTNPPSPALTWGDAPWRYGQECGNGIFRGFQIYNDKLSDADILSEIASPLSTGAGAASIWYLNLNPTPDDITDKSGAGNHPAWVSANKASLYSVGEGFPSGGIGGDLLRRKFGRTL
ncbi:MAG TPA: hypothetical protein PKA61_07625 [Nitrospira sp.]|nr:hypothetical protein [Nitrospira sp.]